MSRNRHPEWLENGQVRYELCKGRRMSWKNTYGEGITELYEVRYYSIRMNMEG
jgi:hypothetical protein